MDEEGGSLAVQTAWDGGCDSNDEDMSLCDHLYVSATPVAIYYDHCYADKAQYETFKTINPTSIKLTYESNSYLPNSNTSKTWLPTLSEEELDAVALAAEHDHSYVNSTAIYEPLSIETCVIDVDTWVTQVRYVENGELVNIFSESLDTTVGTLNIKMEKDREPSEDRLVAITGNTETVNLKMENKETICTCNISESISDITHTVKTEPVHFEQLETSKVQIPAKQLVTDAVPIDPDTHLGGPVLVPVPPEHLIILELPISDDIGYMDVVPIPSHQINYVYSSKPPRIKIKNSKLFYVYRSKDEAPVELSTDTNKLPVLFKKISLTPETAEQYTGMSLYTPDKNGRLVFVSTIGEQNKIDTITAALDPSRNLDGFCNRCIKQTVFDSDTDFVKHMALVHASCATYKSLSCYTCPLCYHKATSPAELIEHFDKEHQSQPLKCVYCSGQWPTVQLLTDHIEQIHRIKHPFQMSHIIKMFFKWIKDLQSDTLNTSSEMSKKEVSSTKHALYDMDESNMHDNEGNIVLECDVGEKSQQDKTGPVSECVMNTNIQQDKTGTVFECGMNTSNQHDNTGTLSQSGMNTNIEQDKTGTVSECDMNTSNQHGNTGTLSQSGMNTNIEQNKTRTVSECGMNTSNQQNETATVSDKASEQEKMTLKTKSVSEMLEERHIWKSGDKHRCTLCGWLFCAYVLHAGKYTSPYGQPGHICQLKDKPYKCKYCDYTCFTQLRKDQHYIRDHVQNFANQIPCPRCSLLFKNVAMLKKHYETEHMHRKQCPVCHKVCRNENISKHMKIHKDKQPYRCSLCGKSYVTKPTLERHIELTHHSLDKAYVCEYCGKEHITWTMLREHLNNHKTRVCEICGKRVKRSLYYLHRSSHKGKGQLCNVCGKMIVNRKKFEAHIAIHAAGYAFKCDLCGLQFALEIELDYHKQHHDEYTCPICKKVFKSKTYMRYHKGVHTGRKPCSCSLCWRSFMSPKELHYHKKEYHGYQKTKTGGTQ